MQGFLSAVSEESRAFQRVERAQQGCFKRFQKHFKDFEAVSRQLKGF